MSPEVGDDSRPDYPRLQEELSNFAKLRLQKPNEQKDEGQDGGMDVSSVRTIRALNMKFGKSNAREETSIELLHESFSRFRRNIDDPTLPIPDDVLSSSVDFVHACEIRTYDDLRTVREDMQSTLREALQHAYNSNKLEDTKLHFSQNLSPFTEDESAEPSSPADRPFYMDLHGPVLEFNHSPIFFLSISRSRYLTVHGATVRNESIILQTLTSDRVCGMKLPDNSLYLRVARVVTALVMNASSLHVCIDGWECSQSDYAGPSFLPHAYLDLLIPRKAEINCSEEPTAVARRRRSILAYLWQAIRKSRKPKDDSDELWNEKSSPQSQVTSQLYPLQPSTPSPRCDCTACEWASYWGLSSTECMTRMRR